MMTDQLNEGLTCCRTKAAALLGSTCLVSMDPSLPATFDRTHGPWPHLPMHLDTTTSMPDPSAARCAASSVSKEPCARHLRPVQTHSLLINGAAAGTADTDASAAGAAAAVAEATSNEEGAVGQAAERAAVSRCCCCSGGCGLLRGVTRRSCGLALAAAAREGYPASTAGTTCGCCWSRAGG